MPLIDLKYTKADIKKEAREMNGGATPDLRQYPWGLEIRLEDEELTKLGVQMPAIGDEWHMVCTACVTAVSESRMASGESERCVTLQIEMMAVVDEEAASEDEGKTETPQAEVSEMAKSGSLARLLMK